MARNRQATTRRSTPAYGRVPTRTSEGANTDEPTRRAAEMSSRLEKFNGDWSAISLRKRTVKNAPGQSTDFGG